MKGAKYALAMSETSWNIAETDWKQQLRAWHE